VKSQHVRDPPPAPPLRELQLVRTQKSNRVTYCIQHHMSLRYSRCFESDSIHRVIMLLGDYESLGIFVGVMLLVMFCRNFQKNNEDSMSAEQFAKYQYESSSATNLLSQEHIEAIALRQWKQVLAWVAFHSDQVSRVEDIKGQTILHHAALFRAPADVMEFLLWAAPELASVPNKDGELALHWAVRLSTPSQILALLLSAYPESAFLADANGSTPLSLLWEKHQITLLQIWRTERQRLLDETDCVWRRIMSVYRALNEREIENEGRRFLCKPFLPLHLAAAHTSPPCLFPLMIQVYKEELKQRDIHGRLALSVACKFPLANRSCDVLTKIQMLLREYPAAAKIPDPKLGQYPLFIALSSGILWNDGIQSLIQAFPMALSFRDPQMGLFPFGLAAIPRLGPVDQRTMNCCSTCLELDTVYNTLRADPSVLRLCGF
jgi:ankyrin repeat protein